MLYVELCLIKVKQALYKVAKGVCAASVPYSQLTVCAKWTYNVHNDRIYKEQEYQKHVTTSCSGTKPFY